MRSSSMNLCLGDGVLLPQGSLQITLTEAQRKMVVRSLATTIENLRSYPGESTSISSFKNGWG